VRIDECRAKVRHTRVKVEEKGRKAVFLNPTRAEFYVTRIDGCIVQNARAADYMVTKCGVGDIVVELKGTDTVHAVSQIAAAIPIVRGGGHCTGRFVGLIVCRRYPKVDTSLQRARSAFRKSFRTRVHVVSRNREYDFEHVLLTDELD
jgi:hypothetical protein